MATGLTGGDGVRDQAHFSTNTPSSEFRFRDIKSIEKPSRFAVYGFVRRCQALLAAKLIPELVHFTILIYYRVPEVFSVNNSDTFAYDKSVHEYGYHIYGTKQVARSLFDEYRWTVQFKGDRMGGTMGIIDDEALQRGSNVPNGKLLRYSSLCKNVAVVGTISGCWEGMLFGQVIGGGDAFIHPNDVITVHLDYKTNMISFTSQQSEQTISRQLKDGIKRVKFVAEFGGGKGSIRLLS